MPKGNIIKSFGRRKSAGNVLDNVESPTETAPTSTFRVIERPEKKISYGNTATGSEVKRSFVSPLQALRGKSVDNLTLGQNRGSAGTTNSGSSGYYDSSATSARHSSSSTLPSSLDQEREEEDDNLFLARKKTAPAAVAAPRPPPHMSTPPPAPEDLPPPPSFSARAARAFSFGSRSKPGSKDLARDLNNGNIPPVPPPHTTVLPRSPPRAHSPQRERALTTSSYASTTVPTQTKTELTLTADFGGNDDFGSMFDNMRRTSTVPPGAAGVAAGTDSHRTDSIPLYPPKTLSRRSFNRSQNNLRREEPESPYSMDFGASEDSSAMSSPGLLDSRGGNGYLQASKTGYSLVPDRQNSPSPGPEESLFGHKSTATTGTSKFPAYESDTVAFPNRQNQIEDDDRWAKRVELRDPQGGAPVPSPPRTNVASSSRGTPVRTVISPPPVQRDDDILNRTPRASHLSKDLTDEPLFDSSPNGPPSRAVRPSIHARQESTGGRRMTKEMFKFLQRREEGSNEQSEDEATSTAHEEEYDDEDDVERARRLAAQRRKQEANMSVYRQQMKRVTGGGPTDLPPLAQAGKPEMYRGSSASSLGSGLHLGGVPGGPPPSSMMRSRQTDSDEDEDVPLGILQAHGFPSGGRQPTRAENDMEYQKRASVAGSVMNGASGGNLPAFARRLPADPYFGAGIVNQSNRESFAMHSSAASTYGMPAYQPQAVQSPGGHPAGLVGVIAVEEKARAARRASPSPHAGFGSRSSTALPLPSNMQQPQFPRTMSMGNQSAAMAQMYNPNGMMMPGMMMPPQMDPNSPQMQQYMQMQMQLMQNMLAMQQASMGQQQMPGVPTFGAMPQSNDFLSVNNIPQQRPMSIASNSVYGGNPTGRSMTMTAVPAGWNAQSRPTSTMYGGGMAAPSISNFNMLGGGGPGPGYTPSIAPSERSNIGLPGRYRSVSNINGSVVGENTRPGTSAGMGARSQSMTSSMTLQAFSQQQTAPHLTGTPFNGTLAGPQQPKSTIRVLEKSKGTPARKPSPARADEDEEEGWAEMKKKRESKKKSRWGLGGGDSSAKAHNRQSSRVEQQELGDLYRGLDV